MNLSRFTKKDLESCKELEFKIYHGTSSVFLESIKEQGFGYRDNEIFNEEILKNLFESLKHIDSEVTTHYSWIVPAMLEGRFSYEGVFLTPSKSQAIRYASLNKLGEYLTVISDLYEELLLHDKEKANLIIPPEHKLQKIFQTQHIPILISLNNFRTDELRGENGSPLTDVLEKIYRTYWDIKDENIEIDNEVFSTMMEQKDIIFFGNANYESIEIEYLDEDNIF